MYNLRSNPYNHNNMMLYATSSLEITCNCEERRLYLRCLTALSSAEFRQGLKQALFFAEEHQIKQWLLDLHTIGTLDEEEEIWLHQYIFPRIMMNLGTENYVAMVLSEKCYLTLLHEAGKFGLQSYNEFIIINSFFDVDGAVRWLDKHRLPYLT